MRKDKILAIKLRLQGKSYGEIQKSLGVPKSTLSQWLSNVVISEQARTRIEQRSRKKSVAGLIKRNKQQTINAQIRAKNIRKQAIAEMADLSKKDLLILGSALYWAEGYKKLKTRNGKEVTHHGVSLTNSDPFLVKIFLRFLREYCNVPEEKIKAGLRIFEHHNADEILKFWQKETKILFSNFGKIYRGISISSQRKRPFNRLPYGVIQINVNDTALFHKIMGYIEGIKKLV